MEVHKVEAWRRRRGKEDEERRDGEVTFLVRTALKKKNHGVNILGVPTSLAHSTAAFFYISGFVALCLIRAREARNVTQRGKKNVTRARRQSWHGVASDVTSRLGRWIPDTAFIQASFRSDTRWERASARPLLPWRSDEGRKTRRVERICRLHTYVECRAQEATRDRYHGVEYQVPSGEHVVIPQRACQIRMT